MSAFTSLNEAQKSIVVNKTNEAIKGLIHNNDLKAINVKPSELDKAITPYSKILLSASGVNWAVNTPGGNNTINSANTIVKNIKNGTITEDTLPTFQSYDNNTVLGTMSNDVGKTATAMNNLLNTNAAENYNASSNGNNGNANIDQAKDGLPNTISSPEFLASIMNDYSPKLNFFYVVNIILYDEYQLDVPTNFAFLIKKFDKPKTTVEYEDVYMYNFKTQAPKRVNFSPVHFETHNDYKSESLNFIVAYLRRICPIFSQQNIKLFESNGMTFENSSGSYHLNTNNNNTSIMQQLDIYDIYNGGKTMDVYSLINPKISDISFNDWNMEDANGTSTITVELLYDSWTLDVGVEAAFPAYTIPTLNLVPATTPQKLQAEGAAIDEKYTNLIKEKSSDPSEKTNSDPSGNYNYIPYESPEDGIKPDNITPDEIQLISPSSSNVDKTVDNVNTASNEPAQTYKYIPYQEPEAQTTTTPSGVTPGYVPYKEPITSKEGISKSLLPDDTSGYKYIPYKEPETQPSTTTSGVTPGYVPYQAPTTP